MKTIISKIKISLPRLNRKVEMTEERVVELYVRSVEIS